VCVCVCVYDNIILEGINTFTYLRFKVCCEGKKDIISGLSKFLQILGIVNNILKPNLVQRQSLLKVYNILAVP
jgi:hypothetical protein